MVYWKYLLWFLFIYFLALIQVSFLPRFGAWGTGTADLIFLAVFLWSLLAAQKKSFTYFLAIWGGFFLESYSGLPLFGLWIITMLALVLLVKKLKAVMRHFNIFSLILISLAAFLFFKFFPLVLAFLFTLIQKKVLLFPWNFSYKALAVNLMVDLVIAVFIAYLYEFIHQKKSQRN